MRNRGGRPGGGGRTIARVSLVALFAVALLAPSAVLASGTGLPTQCPPTCEMTVRETGLPAGTSWTLQVMNSSGHQGRFTITNASFSAKEPQGPVQLVVPPDGMYAPNTTFHSFDITGRPVWWNLTFVKNTSALSNLNNSSLGNPTVSSGGGSSGIPTSEYAVLGIVAAIAVVAVIMMLRIRARPRSSGGGRSAPAEDTDRPSRRSRAEADDAQEESSPSAVERRRARRERREGGTRPRPKPRTAASTGESSSEEPSSTDEES